jgi:hypothetical protein
MCERLPLETKQPGGKLPPPSAPRGGGGGVSMEEVSRSRKRKRDILLGTWSVRSLHRAGSLMTAVKKWDVGVGTGLGWLRIGICGGRLSVR